MDRLIEDIFLGIYLDDVVLVSKSNKNVSFRKSQLKKKFDIEEHGTIGRLLGMESLYNISNVTLFVPQRAHAENILKRVKMKNFKFLSKPMEKTKSQELDAILATAPYQNAIASLIFLSSACRADVCSATNF